MQREFNTSGPCNPQDHYMLQPQDRLPQVQHLIDSKKYFVIHAPRQTGKTTALFTLAKSLTESGKYVAVWLSMQEGASFNQNIDAAEAVILDRWRWASKIQLPPELQPPEWTPAAPGGQLAHALATWAEASPRPLVVFLDEIDALQNELLISVLHQIRGGYLGRPHYFPHSLALVGMRDVRDYKVSTDGKDRLRTSSPFNIKAASILMRSFTQEEVATLYQQHTNETGQVFTPEAIAQAFYLTQGQPWLINALANECVTVLVPNLSHPIQFEHINQAKEALIQQRQTHLDSLTERLHESRVRQIIVAMFSGTTLDAIPKDDLDFVIDLGLCRREPNGHLRIANPIYDEIIPRVLADQTSISMQDFAPSWLNPEGILQPHLLLDAFLQFWRQHAEPLFTSTPYPEIAPHIVLLAFLHRVVNSGGTIEREYAIGRGRMDLCLRYGAVTMAIELKVWRDSDRHNPFQQGLAQLDRYLTGLSLETGWLVIFDQRSNQPPLAERTRTEDATTPDGRNVVVVWG